MPASFFYINFHLRGNCFWQWLQTTAANNRRAHARQRQCHKQHRASQWCQRGHNHHRQHKCQQGEKRQCAGLRTCPPRQPAAQQLRKHRQTIGIQRQRQRRANDQQRRTNHRRDQQRPERRQHQRQQQRCKRTENERAQRRLRQRAGC